MNTIKVRKELVLCGTDAQDLCRRVDRFRGAIRSRHGVILSMKRRPRGAESPHSVAILYQLPLSAGDIESSVA